MTLIGRLVMQKPFRDEGLLGGTEINAGRGEKGRSLSRSLLGPTSLAIIVGLESASELLRVSDSEQSQFAVSKVMK